MHGCLRFGVGCHGEPVTAGRWIGVAPVERADRLCTYYDDGAFGDERHLILECKKRHV